MLLRGGRLITAAKQEETSKTAAVAEFTPNSDETSISLRNENPCKDTVGANELLSN